MTESTIQGPVYNRLAGQDLIPPPLLVFEGGRFSALLKAAIISVKGSTYRSSSGARF